jgi:hypothetical protein
MSRSGDGAPATALTADRPIPIVRERPGVAGAAEINAISGP